jgi:hypothetical protein
VLLKLAPAIADSSPMLGFGSRDDSRRRTPLVDWRSLAPYGCTVVATLLVGWAISQLG